MDKLSEYLKEKCDCFDAIYQSSAVVVFEHCGNQYRFELMEGIKSGYFVVWVSRKSEGQWLDWDQFPFVQQSSPDIAIAQATKFLQDALLKNRYKRKST